MTFLSYAQNFEDVMLWRALRGVQRGFYIDVGAAHPDIDSVTRAFYDRGWSGINIEPVESSARRLTAARTRDITLQIAVGASSGPADFFVVEGTGLSTLQPTALPEIGKLGFAAEATRIQMTTLADICREHASADIHFLKIDVEGAEAAVLLGADFALFRPWIILAEATALMSAQDISAAWEPILLQAGYQFVYFDGLNRFYVADERYDELAATFRVPPNVFDDFLRVADTESARRIADAQAKVVEFETTSREAVRAKTLARAFREENERLVQVVASLQAANAAALQAAESARSETREAASWLAAMRASTSWRMTAPLRLLIAMAKAARRRASARPPAVETIAPLVEVQTKLSLLDVPPLVKPTRSVRTDLPRLTDPAPLRLTVHQFHSGSAIGDAITNAMLLTRTLLRRQGYTSEIFVEHLDPLLTDELRPMDELPVHAGYVLIVRHSIGYDVFDRIAALLAPKILIYHNITPEAFLVGAPALQHYCRLGRVQLAKWRPLVVRALADGEFNAIELRRLGFEEVHACTLLFDVATLRARAADKSAAHRDGVFTILFVGRIIASKAQDDLVKAYAKFRRQFAGPSRLVLVGRHDGPGSAYFDTLHAHIKAEALDEHVTLTGLVPDDELHAWYSAADLYVSLSRHEGFGVPLVEAMAYDVPILALPSGAIPYTLGGTGQILPDATPRTAAAAMLGLARDPERRARIAERQRRSLDRFALDRQMRPLMRVLAQAGAAQLEDAATRTVLAANMCFTITGHVNKTYSLAAINRTLALTIEAERPGCVRMRPVEGQPTTDLSEVPEPVRAEIARLTQRGDPDTGPAMVISQHYPVVVPEDLGDIGVALFFWEESVVPAATIELLNRSFHGVLAPTRSVAKTLIDSGLSIPVSTIGYLPALDGFRQLRRRNTHATEGFSFLHVSSGFPRKGIDVLLAAFARAFSSADPVRLIIKVFPNPHNDVAAQIEQLRMRASDVAEIVLIDRDSSDSDLLDLYGDADAVVLPTRGEGFNLPAAEAMAAGIPLIVTGFGGHMDFCAAKNARLLGYRFAPSGSHLATAHSLWIEPDEDDLVAALQEAVFDRPAAAARAQAACKAVDDMQDRAAFIRRLADFGVSRLLASPPAPMRIGWVSTWQVRCGIAGYSAALLAAMPKGPEFIVFCDRRTDVGSDESGGVTLRRAWRVGDVESLPGLTTAIAAADPQVLVVQHQPALLPWGALGKLLTARAVAERTVVVTLHNTRHLVDVGVEERDAALAALASVARVIVHTVADINLLKDLGLVENVMVLPHGAVPCSTAAAPRHLTPDDEVIIGCYGFFLPGKGIGALIQAVAILHRQWKRVRLRLVNADYGTPEAAEEIARCRALVEQLSVPVEWHTDFLPDDHSLALLSGCDIVALPYQESKEASSAALRTALRVGGVVAVTDLALFDEAEDAVFRFGRDPESIAEGMTRLLSEDALRLHTRQAAARWIAARNWSAVAARLQGMLIGLTQVT